MAEKNGECTKGDLGSAIIVISNSIDNLAQSIFALARAYSNEGEDLDGAEMRDLAGNRIE